MADNLVGLRELAARAHVERDTVLKWRTRHKDFPRPIANLAMGPLWRWSHVRDWLRRTGRL